MVDYRVWTKYNIELNKLFYKCSKFPLLNNIYISTLLFQIVSVVCQNLALILIMSDKRVVLIELNIAGKLNSEIMISCLPHS